MTRSIPEAGYSRVHDHRLRYALITPARNEADFIAMTIESVLSQTVRPLKWIIVSDGSTDGTGEIVKRYLSANEWIELIQKPARETRNFAGKANAFNEALEKLSPLPFDIVANLDADISFPPQYFEFLLSKFAANDNLGVAGTRYTEVGSGVAVFSQRDVAGQCQVFRRECIEAICGYYPSKYGGVDWMAVRMARMRGWETLTFEGMVFEHHRIMSSADANRWVARLRTGRKDYILGNHPVWEAFRILYQMAQRPYIVGGLLVMIGFIGGGIARLKRPVPPDLMKFHRREQMSRLRAIFRNPLRVRQTIMEV